MIKKTIRFVFGIAPVICFGSARAQQIAPAPYSGNIKVNYIRSWVATSPQSNPDTLLTKPLKDVKQATQYFDGLHRPLQTVVKQGSLSTGGIGYDMVIPNLYDELGRETYRYLPFAANSAGGNSSISDGQFKMNPFQQDSVFNKGLFSDENWFYSQTNYEASPLNRFVESFAPGQNWVGSSGQSSESNRHSIKAKFWLNASFDSVRLWTVNDVAGTFGSYSSPAFYDSAKLYKNVVLDENNHQVIEFRDCQGRLILRKVQLASAVDTGSGKGYSGWLCTYFIYDDLNNLRCVIQPKGVELLIANSWNISALSGAILNEQCYRYEYDYRQRMIMKKVPGMGTLYMIYDARDRLAMSQDSLMRANHQWMYIDYDFMNRPIATGVLTDHSNYNNSSYHRSLADTSMVYPVSGVYSVDTLTRVFYDDYSWRASQGNPLSATRTSTDDSYLQPSSNTIWPYPQNATVQTSQLKGMRTGIKVKVMGTSTYLYTVTFYDEMTRNIQMQSQNLTGGINILTTQYSWNDAVLLSIAKSEKAQSNAQTSLILTQTTYDDLGRVLKIAKKVSNTKVNNGNLPGSWKTIMQNEYNACGQVKKKKLGDTPIDSLNYEYNIRGWMLGMNRAYVKDTTSTANWFGFDLGFDNPNFAVNGSNKSYATAQFNGNIAGLLWKSTGDDQLRKYDFTYDAVNRLTSADFNQLTNNSFSKAAGIDFSVTGLSYDPNGNLLSMNQRGWKIGGSQTIDSLLYTYISNSNKLLNVIDRRNDTTTRLGDFRSSKAYMNALGNNKTTSATDYVYDGNGNMYIDNNKDIANIHYNVLNLPDSVTVANKGSIKYVYAATGEKLKKIVVEGSKVTSTLYLFGTYVNDTLQNLPQELGRIRFNIADSSLHFDYFITDHLGNVRLVLTEQQQSDAYPACTMELGDSSINNRYYSNVVLTRSSLPAGYPVDTSYSNPNQYVSKVSGSGNKIGSAIILKVMAGDKFNLRVSSWYKKNGAVPQPPYNPITDLVAALTSNIGGIAGTHGTVSELAANNTLNPGAINFYSSHSSADSTTKPKAFINWVLFDEQFNYVATNSGFEQVADDNSLTVHTRNDQAINKNGYIYIYVSNETPNIDVFFDNLQVTHIRGPLLEETHYYPFGLSMNGISSIALKNQYPENKYKFNSQTELANKEFSDGSGLEMYETTFRLYDAQIGVFHQIDPLSEITVGWSPYVFCLNNPISFIDPLGLTGEKSTPDNPKVLPNVTVTGTRKKKPQFIPGGYLPINSYPREYLGRGGSSGGDMDYTRAFIAGSAVTSEVIAVITGETAAAGTATAVGVSTGVAVCAATASGVAVVFIIILLCDGPQEAPGTPPPPGFQVRDQTYMPSTVVLPIPSANSRTLPNPNPGGSPIGAAEPKDDDDNSESWRVYEIWGLDMAAKKLITLKYGVATGKGDTYFDESNRRPDSQFANLQKKYPNLILGHTIFPQRYRIKQRAHDAENNYVFDYRAAKKRPDPTNPNFGLWPIEQNGRPSGATRRL